MRARAELAELVMDHLSHNSPTMVATAAVIRGLASIMTAYSDAQGRRGNWSAMLTNLEDGRANIEAALPLLRTAGPDITGLIELAERELGFAAEMHDTIVRL